MELRFGIMFICCQIFHLVSAQRNLNIGGIFSKDSEDVVNAFLNAVQIVNRDNELLKLNANVITVDINDNFAVQLAACKLLKENVVSVFGPNSAPASGIVSSICKRVQVPHFTSTFQLTGTDDYNTTDSYTRNLFPDPRLFTKALYEIIKSFQWRTFAVIYETADRLLKLNDAFTMTMDPNTMGKQKISLFKVTPGTDDHKPLLKSISKSGINQVIIDCSLKTTNALLEQSVGVNMMNEYVNYLIVGFDAYTLDFSVFSDVSANITTIRMFDPWSNEVLNNMYENRRRFGRPIKENQLTSEAALMQDALTAFVKAFGDDADFIQTFRMNRTTCYKNAYFKPTSSGRDILERFDTNIVQGMTDEIHFNKDRIRDTIYLEVLELSQPNNFQFQKFATYDNINGLQSMRNFSNIKDETVQSIHNKVFKVIMHEGMPFLRVKKNFTQAENVTENDMYEGFAKDLIDAIATKIGFKYKLSTAPDYGKEDPITKQWNGIIGEIVNKRADLAIGDITITHARKTAIDFSTPFMTLGISILYAKPHKEKPGLFSFMAPLSIQVWLYMATAFLCISITEFLLAKITDNDWENPHPCDESPQELENIWNMHNCIWLSVGSIMQQGCDILPKGVPTRLAAAVWWFFALIVISSYTANLAAFLTKEQMEASIESVDDLANQNQIRYGLLAGGSTESFFKNSNFSTFQKMWAFMEKAEPSVFVKNNAEGVERVKKGNRMYAFMMESASIKYITHRECNLTQVGNLLDAKEYGIGMPINSPYRTSISQAILLLQEDGTIHNLTEKWWETENTDENGNQVDCNAGEKEASDTPELDMENVGGVFLVLMIGLGTAIFIGILEFVWSVRRVSIDKRITPYEAFKEEALFAIKAWEVRKPVNPSSSRRSSLESSATDNDKDNEGKIRLNSIKNVKINGLNDY